MEFLQKIFEEQQKKALELKTESYKARKFRLKKLKKWILDNRSLIQEALYLDMHKSSAETDLSEIYTVVTELREAISHLRDWTEPGYLPSSLTYLGTTSWTVSEPKGVCLIISPWNYPFNLAIGPVVSAVAAGNTFILKPSEFTPKTSSLIKKMVSDCFSEEIGYVIEGDSTIAKKLLELPFNHIFFTGSSSVGKLIMKAAASHLSSITLELGGKSPTIIDQTADVADTVRKVAWGKWLNAGQTCVAPDFIYVHEKVAERFTAAIIQEAQNRFPKNDYTSIVSHHHLERLQSMLEDAMEKGAKIEWEGGIDKEKQKIYPVILSEVQDSMEVMKEEIFGPLLPIRKFKDLNDVIKQVNRRPKPLSLYIFSTSRKNIELISTSTSSGNLVINDCVLQFAHPSFPFGGINNSGFGKSHGKAGFLAFSNEKSVLKQRRGLTMARLLYPPYSQLKNKLINLLLKYF